MRGQEARRGSCPWQYLLPPVLRAQKVLIAAPQEASQLQLLADPLLRAEEASADPSPPAPSTASPHASHPSQLAQASGPQGGGSLLVWVGGVGGQRGPVAMAEHLGTGPGQGWPGRGEGPGQGRGHLTTATNTRGPSARAQGASSSRRSRSPAGRPQNPGPAISAQPRR